MDIKRLLTGLINSDCKDNERETLVNMICRAVDLYGIERYWDGACSVAAELDEKVLQSARVNAQHATIDQCDTIVSCIEAAK